MKQGLDVIVPVYGAIPLLLKCLESIREFHVVLVDDCSPHSHLVAQAARTYPNVTLVKHAKNKGFIEAIHTGMAQCSEATVLLLNSDVIANSMTVWKMLETISAEHEHIGIVGCKLLYPKDHPVATVRGRIQHCGVLRGIDGFPYHPFALMLGNTPHASTLIELNCVTGGAMMIRRQVWDELGGFDRKYSPGVFEDVAFCWNAIKRGWRIFCENRVFMYHYEHGSKVAGQPYFGDGGVNNGMKLMQEFGFLGSDEELLYGEPKGVL